MSATILHTESSVGWGGQEIRIYTELVHLRERGHRMLIACHPDSHLARRAEKAGLEVRLLPFRRPIDPRLTWQMHRLFRQEQVDLVNTHSSVDSWVASLAAWMAAVPVVRTRHLSVPLKADPFSLLVYSRLCDRIVTTGEVIRELLIREARVRPSKVVSIPTGIDLKQFDPLRVDGEAFRRELGISKDIPVIGMVAVLRSWKGHRIFLEAVRLTLEVHSDAKFLIVGDGPMRAIIEGWVEKMELQKAVIMAGHREEIPEVLAALDVFVLSSIAAEGVPQAVVQALAMGKPVVATDVGGVREVIQDGETGLMVPARDPAALAIAITTLLSDRERAAALGAAGRPVVEKHFSLETMVDRLEVLYAEMLGGRRGS